MTRNTDTSRAPHAAKENQRFKMQWIASLQSVRELSIAERFVLQNMALTYAGTGTTIYAKQATISARLGDVSLSTVKRAIRRGTELGYLRLEKPPLKRGRNHNYANTYVLTLPDPSVTVDPRSDVDTDSTADPSVTVTPGSAIQVSQWPDPGVRANSLTRENADPYRCKNLGEKRSIGEFGNVSAKNDDGPNADPWSPFASPFASPDGSAETEEQSFSSRKSFEENSRGFGDGFKDCLDGSDVITDAEIVDFCAWCEMKPASQLFGGKFCSEECETEFRFSGGKDY